MEYLALENSSFTEQDLLLTEIKQEIEDIEDEAEWIAAQVRDSSTDVLNNLHTDSSDTEDAEIPDCYGDTASEIKPELSDTATNGRHSRQCDLSEHSYSDDSEQRKKAEVSQNICHCKICGRCFPRPKSLSAHMRTAHKKTAVIRETRVKKTLVQTPPSVESPYRLRLRSHQKSASNQNASPDADKPHACKICHRRFRISRDLNLHLRIHSGVKPNTCSDCGKQFTTVSQLRSHYRTHTQEAAYSCTMCDQKFVWLNSLKRHMRVHREDQNASGMEGGLLAGSATQSRQNQKKNGRPHKPRWSADMRSSCNVCGKWVIDMRKHLLTHSGEKRHQCILCGSCFSIASSLTVHMRMHTGERPFGCDECSRRFTTRSHLTVHMRKHTREEPYRCMLCGEKFVWLNSMKRHMQLHDDVDSPINQLYALDNGLSTTGDSSVPSEELTAAVLQDSMSEMKQDASEHAGQPCEIRGKTFIDMWKHQQMHVGHRPHQCPHCGRCYMTAESLRTHTKVHTTEKKFVCAECGSRFRQMSHLRVHMRIHSEELRYECGVCGEKFLWQNSLKRHMWKHDGGVVRERNHRCPICAKSFFAAYLLRVHMQSHSGDKPHMCHQCGRRYSSRSSLRCHQRYSHLAQPRHCPECGKQFKSWRVVKQHMRIAHRGTLHRCPHCDLEFRQRSWLDCHILSHFSQQLFTCDECRLSCNGLTDTTEPSTEADSQQPCDSQDTDAVLKQDGDLVTNVIVPPPNSSMFVNNTSADKDISCSTAVSSTSYDLTEDGSCTIANNVSVPGSALPTDRATFIAETDSVPYTNDASQSAEDDLVESSVSRAVVEDGIGVSRELAGSGSMDNEGLPAVNLMTMPTECSTVPPAEDEVRCIQCNKVREPQCCPVCSRTFALLPLHISAHSGRNPYVISSLLGIPTTYADDDDGEGTEPGGEERVQCDDGGLATVSQPRRRKRHRMPQQCTVCGRTYTKLAEHMARMHGEAEPCMCTGCGKFLRNANTLRAHMLSRTCLKSRVCPICERTCENDAGLKSHMRSHASVDHGTDEQSDELVKAYHCNECGHAFSSSEALDTHMALHAAGKHHICCVCGRTFIRARSLRLHLRIHTDETPFECKACGKGFRSQKGLSEHRSVHTMEKRYACMTCGRRFRLYRTYSRHRVIHSGVKRYECSECGLRFSFNHLRKRHMRTHSGEKPYVCSDCGDRFAQWNGLYQHRQRRCGKLTKSTMM